MPIHGWTRAPSGYFHHFHQCWTGRICDALNSGLLPKGIFALIVQASGDGCDWPVSRNGVALATELSKTRFVSRTDQEIVYAAMAKVVALYRDNETIALIEIVSPGNKGSQLALKQFVEKSMELLDRGIHLLVVDLFPPSLRDPQGIHPAIWSGIKDEPFLLPDDKPLTLASYVAGPLTTASVEPVAVGDMLPAMPLFLEDNKYVRVPLEETYEATWNACPEEFKQRVI